jgi:hypothetical protein
VKQRACEERLERLHNCCSNDTLVASDAEEAAVGAARGGQRELRSDARLPRRQRQRK